MANPGILRQYLEDYAAAYDQKAADYTGAVTAHNAGVAEYNKTLALDANGKPQFYQQSVSPGAIDETTGLQGPDVAAYAGMTQHADGNWYVDGPQYAGDALQLSAVPDSKDVYQARQGGTPRYGADKTVTGYDYPVAPTNAPADFVAPATPEFTQAQAKQIGAPTAGQAMSLSARGSEGVIARYLNRKEG